MAGERTRRKLRVYKGKERLNLVTRTTHRPTRSSAWMYVRQQPHAVVYRYLSILLIDICIPNVGVYTCISVYTDARCFRPTVADISLLSRGESCWRLNSYTIRYDQANENKYVKFSEIPWSVRSRLLRSGSLCLHAYKRKYALHMHALYAPISWTRGVCESCREKVTIGTKTDTRGIPVNSGTMTVLNDSKPR